MKITPQIALMVNILWIGPLVFEGLQEAWSAPWALLIILQLSVGYKMWEKEERRNKNAEIHM